MSDDLQPKINDAPLSDFVVDARAFCAELEDDARMAQQPAFAAHLEAYRRVLQTMAKLLAVLPDTSHMDFMADTRSNALWLLMGRCTSLALNMVDQIEAGYGVEVYPTARSIHEANRLIFVFSDPHEDDLVRQWLRGHTPKTSTLRRAVTRIEKRDHERRQKRGDPPIKSVVELDLKLYDALSGGGIWRGSPCRCLYRSPVGSC
jgi:hypothetical protein